MLTEKELIKGCRKGKIQHQEGLYRQFYSFGMSVCIRYAPNRDDAMEILNDAFMKVFDNIKRYDEDKPFKSWFRRILINTALDHYRANKKYRLQVDIDETILEDIPYEIGMDQSLEIDEIVTLFNQLPEIYRLTFNLYEIEGYNHEEIAGMLDVAPGTSRSNLSRAKKMLKALYFNNKKRQCHEAV